jgi:Conserved hypothetical protein (DUF2461)
MYARFAPFALLCPTPCAESAHVTLQNESGNFLPKKLHRTDYDLSVKPGGESLLAAGTWCPGKNELATIRSHIQRDPSRLRRTINAPLFVKNFGPAKPLSKGRRQNIFGRDDELKTAPKGVDKDHK